MATRCSCSSILLRLWEAVQVELHGQYSIKRLRALRAYIASTSLLRAITILTLTPLPGLFIVIGIDALPLVAPEEGASKQTLGFWIRCFYTAWSSVFALTIQVLEIEPALKLSRSRLWFISLAIGVFLLGTMFVAARTIGFPVPFAFQVQTVPLMIALGISWRLSWNGILRANAVVKDNFNRFRKVMRSMGVVFVSYIGFNVVYVQLDGTRQLLFSALLPAMKLLFKVRVSTGVYHLEDHAPVIVVANVDILPSPCRPTGNSVKASIASRSSWSSRYHLDIVVWPSSSHSKGSYSSKLT